MAESNHCGGAVPTTTPSAISSALETNKALQSELKSRLVDVRRLLRRNRHDAAAVLSSLSRTLATDEDTSVAADYSLNEDTDLWTKFTSNNSSFVTDDTDICAGSEGDHEHKHGNRVWTEEELKELQKVVCTLRDEGIATNQIPENETFFDAVASKCSFVPPRSARECHAAFFTSADPTILRTKITKKESRFIDELISELGGGKDVDWLEIASKLNDKLYPSKIHRRTPWQCFKHYQSTQAKAALPWSCAEDELLLKYLAAHGSQFLFTGDGLARTNSNLFPFRNPNKVAIRSHSTLLNPNHVQDWWTEDEERKLALLMRAYSDTTLPLKQASQLAHFPHRAQALVSVKWNRSICPELQRKGRDQVHRDEAF